MPVPDGRRSLTTEAKRVDNARRAEHARATAPFFVGPDGATPVNTDVVQQVICDAATALGLDESVFGSSACQVA